MYFIKGQILLGDEGDDPMQVHIKQQFHYSMKQKVTVSQPLYRDKDRAKTYFRIHVATATIDFFFDDFAVTFLCCIF